MDVHVDDQCMPVCENSLLMDLFKSTPYQFRRIAEFIGIDPQTPLSKLEIQDGIHLSTYSIKKFKFFTLERNYCSTSHQRLEYMCKRCQEASHYLEDETVTSLMDIGKRTILHLPLFDLLVDRCHYSLHIITIEGNIYVDVVWLSTSDLKICVTCLKIKGEIAGINDPIICCECDRF